MSNDYATVDAYNTSLTRSNPTSLSVARPLLAATTVGGYALFAGGDGTAVVDAYNTSLTRSNPTSLSEGKNNNKYLGAATVGGYALFGGGGITIATVNAYNTSLTRNNPTSLSVGKYQLAATTVGGYALFGGGSSNSSSSGGSYNTLVDAYNIVLTKSIQNNLSVGRCNLAATTVGNYALFGGGMTSGGFSAKVDVYQIT